MIDPIKALPPKIKNQVFEKKNTDIIHKGGSFWIERIKNNLSLFICGMSLCIHRWKGAMANFTIKKLIIIELKNKLFILILIITPLTNPRDEILWIKK